MNIRLVQDLLDEKISPETFESSIMSEVRTHADLLNKKGASVPVYLVADGSDHLVMDEQRMQILKRASELFDVRTRAYILDVISLSERFVFLNESDRDWCEEMADLS